MIQLKIDLNDLLSLELQNEIIFIIDICVDRFNRITILNQEYFFLSFENELQMKCAKTLFSDLLIDYPYSLEIGVYNEI